MKAILFAILFTVTPIFTALGQVVQLPVVGEVSVNTSVWVPDGGRTYLGGVNRGAMSRVERGVPLLGPLARNRAIGSSIGSTSAWAHVRIIDPKEEEARLFPDLAEKTAAAEKRGGEGHQAREIASAEVAPLLSVAAIKAQNAAEDSQLEEEAAKHFEQGEAARARGKWSAARSYYLLAAKKSKGELGRRARLLADEMQQTTSQR